MHDGLPAIGSEAYRLGERCARFNNALKAVYPGLVWSFVCGEDVIVSFNTSAVSTTRAEVLKRYHEVDCSAPILE